MAVPGCVNVPARRATSHTGQIVSVLHPSQVDRRLFFRGGSYVFFFFFLSSFLHSPLPSCYVFDPFIYRGQESFMGRWIPSAILWWISIRRINSVFVCGIHPDYTPIHRHQPGQYIIRRNFIMVFVCLAKKKARSGSQKSDPYSMRNCCSVVFFYNHDHQFYLCFFFFHEKSVTSRKCD